MSDNREEFRHFPLATYMCCQEYVVCPAYGVGRCGACGQVPVYLRKEPSLAETDRQKDVGERP